MLQITLQECLLLQDLIDNFLISYIILWAQLFFALTSQTATIKSPKILARGSTSWCKNRQIV